MKYVGIYWTLFAPMIKRSITDRFGKEMAEKAIKSGKSEYRRLLERADDLGPGNPMAMNAYFAYVFAAAWLGSGKKISPAEMGEVMTDVLTSSLLRTVFGMTDLNKKPKKWYKDMERRKDKGEAIEIDLATTPNKLEICIKADQNTPYERFKRVINELQDINESRYKLLTQYKKEE